MSSCFTFFLCALEFFILEREREIECVWSGLKCKKPLLSLSTIILKCCPSSPVQHSVSSPHFLSLSLPLPKTAEVLTFLFRYPHLASPPSTEATEKNLSESLKIDSHQCL